MLMIVAHHFSVHGGFSFPADQITLNRLWTQFIFMGGSLGNDIFVLLSGYFLISSSGINYHKLFKLWLRIFFYSAVIYSVFVYFGLKAFSLKAALKSVMPVTKPQWWFASTYFVMYLLHPYLNTFLRAMNHEDYKKFLAAAGFYWCIITTLTHSNFGANNLMNFMLVYSLAGYFRLWGKDSGSKKFIWYGVLGISINFVSVVLLDIIGLYVPFAGKHALYFCGGMMKPMVILSSLCLLLGFRSLNIPHSKIINILASATFGVYLIHDNNFVRPFLWRTLFKNASYQDSPYLIPYSIAVILTVYISCTVIELIRAKIFRTFSGGRLS
ncbi:MAG: acyltransferase family protein [Synergistaceae bacterium]|nr:acyltransferase family protein [Synergistaceae bacterium]